MAKSKTSEIREPSIIVKPISRYGGLDNIHVGLLILVVILILLLLVVSYSKQITPRNITNSTNCTYLLNGSCVNPIHTSNQIKLAAEKLLASYSNVNSSLSLLPYISNINTMNISYAPAAKQWYIIVRAVNPTTNQSFSLSATISDKNVSMVKSFIETIKPNPTDNFVVTQGVIQLNGRVVCGKNSTQVYWFVDPYAPGALQSTTKIQTLKNKFDGRINITIKALFSTYSQNIAKAYGQNNAQALSSYIVCASGQTNFNNFTQYLLSQYSNGYLSPNTLATAANISKLNIQSLNACMSNSSSIINAQALLAQYYNITTTPVEVTNCQYLSIPQTVNKSICYANSNLC